MTAIIYFGEMVVALILAIYLLATSTFSMGEAVVLFSGGIVALTLGEYIVHRFLLHGIATTQHRIHHAHPKEAIDKIFCKHPVSNAESTPWEDYQQWAPYEGGFATGGAIARRLRWSSMPPPATGRDGGRTKFPCVDAIGDRIGRG
jgi:hypothetical protein